MIKAGGEISLGSLLCVCVGGVTKKSNQFIFWLKARKFLGTLGSLILARGQRCQKSNLVHK